MGAFDLVSSWPGGRVGAAARIPDGSILSVGNIDEIYELASVTKLATAMAALVAIEEGSIGYDTTVGASSIADLLAHCGGIGPDSHEVIATPRTRRIYSTGGYELVADAIGRAAGIPFATYLREAVLEPLGMTNTTLRGSAGSGAWGSVRDLLALSQAWSQPDLVAAETLARAVQPHRGDLDGVLPGFGRQRPNPWGLGPEIRGVKSPHWTGATNSPRTYGHFGRSGTMLWIDPDARTTLVALTDSAFSSWAVTAWPALSDAVLAASSGQSEPQFRP